MVHCKSIKVYTPPPIQLIHRIKSIMCYEEEGPSWTFNSAVMFPNQYKIFEIRKGYSMALMSTFDIP